MNHEEVQALLGAYALDATEEPESSAMREHLASCPRCSSELTAYREVTTMMAGSGPDADDGIWASISEGLEAEAPLFDLDMRRLRNRRGLARWPTAVAAAAAVVALVFLGLQVSHLDSRVDNLQSAVSARGVSALAESAALSPGSRELSLRSNLGVRIGEIVISKDGQAFLTKAELPRLTATKTYQLWGLSGSKLISLGLLGRDPAPSVFKVGPHMKVLMITEEPSGGVVAPTSAVVAKAPLS